MPAVDKVLTAVVALCGIVGILVLVFVPFAKTVAIIAVMILASMGWLDKEEE
jgi:hypothetical protein